MPFDSTTLVASLRASGAWYDEDAMALAPIDGMGIGALAARDLQPHEPLFHLPLSYLLSPWTSTLKDNLSESEWEGLDQGWTRLIMCMMWEESRPDSRWRGYLDNLPTEFDAPMLWSDEERAELEGTDIETRIGRESADELYKNCVLPLLAARPDLFPADSPHFTNEAYHVQGSRILSRGFTVPLSRAGGPPPEDVDEDGDEEEEEEVTVMVPMADMLNAAYERDNARLFQDGDEEEEEVAQTRSFGEGYTMITTKPIKKGEQIYNTYASPPNSELLRKYGHVDILPLPAWVMEALTPEEIGDFPLGNAGDEVELAGDVVVGAAAGLLGVAPESLTERVDVWLEEGEEDTFGLTYPSDPADEEELLPPALVAFARLLTNEDDWARAKKKGKLPKPNADVKVMQVIGAAIKERAARYPQSIAVDIEAAKSGTGRKRLAAVVRLGEKRVLSVVDRFVEAETKRLAAENGDGKRKADDAKGRDKKRRK